jgi:hypothetical protein
VSIGAGAGKLARLEFAALSERVPVSPRVIRRSGSYGDVRFTVCVMGKKGVLLFNAG